MPVATASSAAVVLTCDIAKLGDTIVFTYTVANDGAADVFVMDAHMLVEPATLRRRADAATATTWIGADRYAQVLKGVAALPPGVEPEARILPLAVRLEPGKRLERRHAEAMPLAEHSPYVPEGILRDYQLVPIEGVALNLDVLPAGAPGLVAEARDVGRGWWRLVAEESVVLVRRLACGFRARGLHMLIRTDDYPRPD